MVDQLVGSAHYPHWMGTSARIVTKGCNVDWMRDRGRKGARFARVMSESEAVSPPDTLHRESRQGDEGEGEEVFLFKRNGTRRDIIA